jgi:peptidoglycan-associated lipoprotein
MMTRFRAYVVVLAVGVALAVPAAGCGKKAPEVAVNPAPPPPPPPAPPPPAPKPNPPPPPPPAPAPKPAPTPPPALTEEQLFAKKTLAELNAEKPLADVFFDLDESTIREDAKRPLQANSDWLKKWTSTQIIIEGHADSRGTAEYNLALGSRRADAVKQYLVSLGVPAERITVISKGKEQPFCTQEEESCWQQNRRGHFIISAK